MSGASGTSIIAKPQGVAQESSINDTLDIAPEARYECPICIGWLRDPVVTSCGHRFCRNCIEEWLKRDSACCPVDNMKLQKEDIYPDNFTRREISQQRTKCPNIVRVCLEELSPLDLESHLLICKFRPVQHPLPENEKLRCKFVHVGCEPKFEDEPELERHLEQDVNLHLQLLAGAYKNINITSEASGSSSAIAQQANFWDPPSKNEMDQATTNESLQNLIKALYEKIIILEQKSREQDIIISNMSEQISSQYRLSNRFCNGTYVWYLTDFKSKINAMRNHQCQMIYSPGFYTSYYGYKICMRFNLSPRDPNYVAILIHMMRTEHDNTLEWPFSGRVSISIIHPTESYRTMKETMMTRSELDAFKRPVGDFNPKGFGYTEFALLEDLIEYNFIQNNQLIIKINVLTV